MGPSIKACTHWVLWTLPGAMGLKPLKMSPGTPSVDHEASCLAAAAQEAQLLGLAPGLAISSGGVASPHLPQSEGNLLEEVGSPEPDRQKDSITPHCLICEVPLLSQATIPRGFGWGPRTSLLRGAQGGVRSGGWEVGGRRNPGPGVPRELLNQPSLASPGPDASVPASPRLRDIRAPAAGALRPNGGRRVRQRRVAPGAGSGSLLPTSPAHPWAEAVPEAGRPGTTRRGHERRSPRSPAKGAAHPRTSAPLRSPRPTTPKPRGGSGQAANHRARRRPASPSPGPSRQGGGGLGFKDTLTKQHPDWHSRASAAWRGGTAGPTFPAPLPPFAHPPSAWEEKFGTGEMAWEASSSSLVIS